MLSAYQKMYSFIVLSDIVTICGEVYRAQPIRKIF